MRDHPGAVDRIIAVILTAVSLPSLWMTRTPLVAQYRPADVWGVLLTLAIVVPLAWRRRRRAPLDPQPGLGQIPALVDRPAGAGLDVRLNVEGEHGPLPTGFELSAHRIVQEALTNTLTHAGPATAVVRLCWCPDALDIEGNRQRSWQLPGPRAGRGGR